MAGHFSAFSFVDRITDFAPGKHAKGRFLVPAHVPHFPRSLAVEAVGQLAAWTAMADLDFGLRPVAGLAADLRFVSDVRPGQVLELETVIESCDDEAVKYSGWGDADGARIVELDHSLGPMLPMEEFDSPAAVRERLELLRGPGATAGRFPGVPRPDMELVELIPGESARAMLQVPKEAAFFADHFPRRPVYPATLLLDAQIELSLQAAAGAQRWRTGAQLTPTLVPDMKMRSFIPPGEVLELRVGIAPADGTEHALVTTSARANGKTVAMGHLEIVAHGGGR